MEFEVRFNGSTDNLLEVVDLFTVRRSKKGDLFRWIYDRDGLNFYNLWDVKQKEKIGVFIKAQNLPNSKTLLIVFFPDDKWPELREYWDLLSKEMHRQGWVDRSQIENTEQQLETEKYSTDLSQQPQKGKKGMTKLRQKRAHLFKKLKDENQNLSYEVLAEKANDIVLSDYIEEMKKSNPGISDEELTQRANKRFSIEWNKFCFTKDDVRNDYRDMGWEWKRADRFEGW